MMVKGFSKKHFEYMIESKLAIELDFHILDDGLDILITEPSPSDKIGPLEFFLIQDPIIIIINNLIGLYISFLTSIHDDFAELEYMYGDTNSKNY